MSIVYIVPLFYIYLSGLLQNMAHFYTSPIKKGKKYDKKIDVYIFLYDNKTSFSLLLSLSQTKTAWNDEDNDGW